MTTLKDDGLVDLPTTMRFRARDATIGRTAATPSAVHVLSLAVSFFFLLWENRHQWFLADEWAFIVRRGVVGSADGLFEPHNEHWVALPILLWRALFSVFGVRSYTPYVVVLILVHLAVVHLLWRVILRSGVTAWVATFVCIPFAVLGAGWENLLSAFQFAFIAPLALGLGALLILPEQGPFDQRDLCASALLVVALMCQGTALPMVAIVGLYTLLRRGVRIALMNLAVPGVVYAVWFLGWGRRAPPGPSEPVVTAVQKVPTTVWRGLVAAIENTTDLAGVGPIVLVALAVFLVAKARPTSVGWCLAASMAVGAIGFLTITALRRTSFGETAASAPRYIYIVVALLLPSVALAADTLIRDQRLRLAVVGTAAAVVLLVQVSTLNRNANEWAAIEQEQKRRIVAAAEVLRDGEPALSSLPVPVFSFDLTVPALEQLAREDKLPHVRVTNEDRLTALEYLQSSLTGASELPPSAARPTITEVHGASISPGPAGVGCVEVLPRSPAPTVTLDWQRPASIAIVPASSASLGVRFRDDGSAGRMRAFDLRGGETNWLDVQVSDLKVDLGLPAQGTTSLCELAAVDDEFVALPATASSRR